MSLTRQSNGSEDAQPLPQRQDLAVFLKGHYLRDPLPNHPLNQTIMAWHTSTSTLYSVVDQSDPTTAQAALRESLNFSPEESGEVHIEGLSTYIIVGYAPQKQDQSMIRCVENARQKGPFGVFEPASESGSWTAGNKGGKVPVLVVVPEGRSRTADTKSYGLAMPKNGICKPYTIKKEMIFFRHEFRNNAVTGLSRTKEWAELVKNACTLDEDIAMSEGGEQPDVEDDEPVPKDLESRPPTRAEAFEALTSFARTGNDIYLKEISAKRHLGPAYRALRLFCDRDEQLSNEDAKEVLTYALESGAPIGELTIVLIKHLKFVVSAEAQLFIPYHCLGPYLKVAAESQEQWLTVGHQVAIDAVKSFAAPESSISSFDQQGALSTFIADIRGAEEAEDAKDTYDFFTRVTQKVVEWYFPMTSEKAWILVDFVAVLGSEGQ